MGTGIEVRSAMMEYSKSVGNSWSERMRLIRFRRKRERFRLWTEFKLVPGWLIGMVIAMYLIAMAIVQGANIITGGDLTPYDIRNQPHLVPFALAGIVTAITIPIAFLLFLTGYVYRDARRRGMSPGAWTFLVVVLMPAYLALGFILYFLLREPLPYDCPQCGAIVGARFNYCPNCRVNLHPSCPQCKREVVESDKFCAFCGQDLAAPASAAPLALSSN